MDFDEKQTIRKIAMRKKFECTKSECTKIPCKYENPNVPKSEIGRKNFERPKNQNAEKRTQKLNRFWKCAKNLMDLKMHEKFLPMLGTNLIDWKKPASAKYRTQRLGLTQWLRKSIVWFTKFEMHTNFFANQKRNSEIWKFGNPELNSENRKSGNKFGNSEIRKIGNKFGDWPDFEKCLENLI